MGLWCSTHSLSSLRKWAKSSDLSMIASTPSRLQRDAAPQPTSGTRALKCVFQSLGILSQCYGRKNMHVTRQPCHLYSLLDSRYRSIMRCPHRAATVCATQDYIREYSQLQCTSYGGLYNIYYASTSIRLSAHSQYTLACYPHRDLHISCMHLPFGAYFAMIHHCYWHGPRMTCIRRGLQNMSMSSK